MDNQLKVLSMYALTKRALVCAFSGIAFCAFEPVHAAATYTWVSNSDQDITKNTNWDSVITPTQIDTAVFPDDNSLVDPVLDTTTVSTTFDAFEIDLTGPRQYGIGIVGNNSPTAPTMTLGSFVGPGGGVKTINSTAGHAIGIVEGGVLQLINSASADMNSNGQILYVLRSSDPTTPSSLIFNNSTDAGAAIISLSDIPGVGSVLTFNDASNALTSKTQAANGSSINFNDHSTAGNSTFFLQTASSLTFNDASSLGNSQIFSDASTITFDTLNPNSAANVVIDNLSTLIVNKNIILNAIGDIAGIDSSSILLNNSSLTLNTLSIIGSKISGSGGSLVANAIVVLGGTNTYTGGTTVNGLLFIANVASLPVSTLPYDATVNTNGNLDFFSTNGTTPCNILLADPSARLTVTDSDIAFDGFIQGSGRFMVEDGSIATLSNTQNNYTGGTFIEGTGTLKVNNNTLPVAQSPNASVTLNDSSTVEFDQNGSGTYAGNIILTDPETEVRVSGAGPLTLSGALTGAGSLALDNGGVILTNHGNTYSGGTFVPANSAILGDGLSLQGAIVNDGIVAFNEGHINTFTGSISSTTTDALLVFLGPGKVIFSNDNSGFQGSVVVNGGTLAVNDTLGGSVSVSQEGTLAGIGTLINDVTNSGRIEPGNIIGDSIGTLTIGGNFEQTISGVYVVEIDGNGNTDLINIFGNAHVDGTLVVKPLNGVVNPDKIYTILHANGEVSGIYLAVLSTDARLVPRLIYSPHDIQLTVEHLFSSIANTHNQKVVAAQLQSITNPTPAESAILDAFTVLASSPDTVESARLALSQMSGEQYTNTMISTTTASRQFIRRLYDPLRSIVSASQSSPCRYACECETEFPVTTWMEIGGGRSFLSHDHNCSGYKMASYSFALGAQTTVADSWTFGVAGGYEHDRLDYNIGGSGTNNNGLLGFYGLYKPCGYYLLGDLAIDLNHSKVKRPIVIGDLRFNAHGSPKSVQESLYFEAGKDFGCNSLLLQPFIGLELDIYSSKQISEGGASPLNLVVKKKNHVNAFSRLGVHLSTANACWALSFDFAWQYRLTQLSNHLEERFHDFGNEFKVLGVNIPRNSLDAAANLSISLGCGWDLYAEASAERWSHACSYTFLGGLKYAW